MGDISKKLLGLFLGISLSLGVGAGLGSVHKEASEVKAETLTTNVAYSDFSGGTSSSGSTMTSTISPFTITFDKGYDGGNNTYAQSYANGTITFAGDETVSKINSIVITAFSSSYNGAQSSGSWYVSSGGGSVSVSSTTITYTSASTTTKTVKLKATKQLRWTAMVISYEGATIEEASELTITTSSTTVHVGEELSLTTALIGGSGAYEKTIAWTSSETSVIAAPVNSEEGEKVTLKALSVGTTTITGTVVSPGKASSSLKIEVKAARTQTDMSLHGTIKKTSYYVGDTWDLTGLDIEVTWSTGDPTYVELNANDVMHECTPKTATNISIKSFNIQVLYGDFDKTFTISGITVTEKPIEDKLWIDANSINITKGSSVTYTNFSNLTKSSSDINSNATWAGLVAYNQSNGNALQLNSTSRAIYTTVSSGQKVSKVSMSYSSTNTSSKLYFYGGNKAYSEINKSINEDKNSTLIATLDKDTLSAIIDGNYRYLYIYSSGAIYLSSIIVTWDNYTAKDEAVSYSKYFNENIGCNSEGTTAPEGWSDVKAEWSNVSSDAQTYLKNVYVTTEKDTDILNCINTYEYIIKKYNSKDPTTYNDFMGRDVVSANASNSIYRISDNNTAILVIVLVAFTSVTAIGSYFFFKKKSTN